MRSPLLYDNSSPRPPEALQANNANESLPPSHIPVADNDSLMEEIDLFLLIDGSIPPGEGGITILLFPFPSIESFYVDYHPIGKMTTIECGGRLPDCPNVKTLIFSFIPRVSHPQLHWDPISNLID
ncbi:hypothetical protein Tco_0893252 [Tanacetum coccineum]|uniref:Uncharacterized protein n=1 Tax=Tanacetum coccineum TaxID=301880 RepID=A0ABQ5C8S0_9ASTR